MATLYAHPAGTWDDVVALIGEGCTTWADIDGWHQGTCPINEPIGTTHLWAWNDNRCWAVRLGGWRIVLTELALTDDAAPNSNNATNVQYDRIDAHAFTPGTNLLPDMHNPQFELFRIDGPTPLWFVRERPT